MSPLFVSACFSQGWLPPKRDNPSATTSSFLPSVETCATSKSRSRTKMFVETVLHLLDRSEQQHSPLQIPFGSRPRLSNTLLCGGQKGQGCGHKSNGGQKEAKACGDGAERPPGMVPSPFSRRGELAMLSTVRKRADHSVTGLVLVRWGSNWATKLSRDSAHGPTWMPLFATHAGALSGLVRVATCGLDVSPLTICFKRESPFQPLRVLRGASNTLPTSG